MIDLVGEVGHGVAGLALERIGVGLDAEVGRDERLKQELGKLRDAADGEGVHELEGRDGVQTHHSFRLGEESGSSCDAHQRVLEVDEGTLHRIIIIHRQYVTINR